MEPTTGREEATVADATPTDDVTSNANGNSPSVLDIFQEARDAIPEEEMAKLPVDGAAQVDHYVYGLPKR